MVREKIDPELDYLYNKNVRCPYCHAKILKYTTTCRRCGIHKRQIFEASNVRAKEIMKERSGAKIFMTRRKPSDVSFTRMAMLLIVGLFGAHCFYVGRKIRAWFFVICTTLGLICVIIVGAFVPQSAIEVFTNKSIPFPTDFLIVASLACWAYDIFAVVFGFFKYPIRLGEMPNTKPTASTVNLKSKVIKMSKENGK